MEEREGKVLLTTKEWPYSVLQVVPTTPETYNEVVEGCSQRCIDALGCYGASGCFLLF